MEWHLETQRALEQAIADTGLQCAVMLDILGTEVLVTGRHAASRQIIAAGHDRCGLTLLLTSDSERSAVSCRLAASKTDAADRRPGRDRSPCPGLFQA